MQDITPLLDLGFSPTIADRLNRRLVRAANGCLEWTGGQYRFGHGSIARGARTAGNDATHRVAWMLEHGPIPDGMFVCHHCDNPPCCEPTHLYLGTAASNTNDMRNRNRFVALRGEASPRCRITDQQVRQMRADYPNICSYTKIARQYGIDKTYARALILGLSRPS